MTKEDGLHPQRPTTTRHYILIISAARSIFCSPCPPAGCAVQHHVRKVYARFITAHGTPNLQAAKCNQQSS